MMRFTRLIQIGTPLPISKSIIPKIGPATTPSDIAKINPLGNILFHLSFDDELVLQFFGYVFGFMIILFV